jgi:hypothetical protein
MRTIRSVSANTAKQLEYVGALFDLLRRKRIERMRDLGIQREDTTPEFAPLSSRMTKVIFDHLVVTQRDALELKHYGNTSWATSALGSQKVWSKLMSVYHLISG